MSTQLKLRRGTTAQHSTFTGAEGEITVDTTKDTVVVHDGSTAGGIPLAKESGSVLSPTSVTLSSGTANGVAYLNGSKVLTTGSALTFDGTKLSIADSSAGVGGQFGITSSSSYGTRIVLTSTATNGRSYYVGSNYFDGAGEFAVADATAGQKRYVIDSSGNSIWYTSSTEQMRLTSTGLGIGTSSPVSKLDVAETATIKRITSGNTMDLNFYNGSGSGTAGNVARIRADGDNTSNDYGALSFWTGRIASAPISEKMRLDSSGNLGLGVTPSAWWGGVKAFDVNTVSSLSGGSNFMNLMTNGYLNSSLSYIYKTSSYATLYQQSSNGQHQWYTAPSGTAGNAISFTQAMTLDASGNLLVGSTAGLSTTTPIKISTGGSYGTTLANGLKINVFESGATQIGIGINAGIAYLYTPDNTVWGFATNGSERMRIDSSGNLLVGTTSTIGGDNKFSVKASGTWTGFFQTNGNSGIGITNDTGTASYPAIGFFNGGTSYNVQGSIFVNASSVTYNTSSDYRLKENIQPMQNALDVVAQLNPVRYTWKADGSDGQGFIAHELQAVVPDCVTGEKDAVDAEGKPVYQGVDTSFLVATLTKAIQEQQEQINQLKAEVAALKGA